MDWDSRAANYMMNFLGPFAEEMTAPDAQGHCRNLLLNKIREKPPGYFKNLRIADYGCGPGNLLYHVADTFELIDGIDFTPRFLEIAAARAARLGIRFFPVQASVEKYVPGQFYDLIVSVNSILPPERGDVGKMLKGIRAALAHDGEFWAIMPSFDTTEHLMRCMREDFEKRLGTDEATHRVADFRIAKKFDPNLLSYADDGENIQCFHTPESIARDLAEAGLELIEPLQKVHYPWELTRRFDYGYFPGKEEIWDWFVVAKPRRAKK